MIKYNYSTQSQCPQSQCLSGEANFLFAAELYSHVVAWTKLGDNVAGVDCTGQQQHPSSLNSGFSYNFVLGFAAFLGLHITSSQQAKLLTLHIANGMGGVGGIHHANGISQDPKNYHSGNLYAFEL